MHKASNRYRRGAPHYIVWNHVGWQVKHNDYFLPQNFLNLHLRTCLERGRERCLCTCPGQGPNPQAKSVPWPGINLETLRCIGRLSHSGMAAPKFLICGSTSFSRIAYFPFVKELELQGASLGLRCHSLGLSIAFRDNNPFSHFCSTGLSFRLSTCPNCSLPFSTKPGV